MLSPPSKSTDTPLERPAVKEKWFTTPWARRFAVVLGGGMMLALCPFVPWPPVRAVCMVVGQALSGAGSIPDLPISSSSGDAGF
jgi:hypothetical protein